MQPGDHLGKGLAAAVQRPRADVRAGVFDQVVSHDDDRNLGQDRPRDGLAADAFLKHRKGQNLVVLEGQDLAVDGGTLGQGIANRRKLGIALGHQLLPARPEESLRTAADELAADAVPFPFRLPRAPVAERLFDGPGAELGF